MGLFRKAEVTVLKESSDAREYLDKLRMLQEEVEQGSDLAKIIDKEIAITAAGIAGEEAILFELKNSGMDLVVLHDLYIETSDGRGAQIDYLVITPYVNALIECKNLFGNIEINNKGEFIRAFSYQGHWIREGIYSPVTQNERHLQVFKDCRTENNGVLMRLAKNMSFDKYNKSIVVLANPKTVIKDRYAPKAIKEKVIRGDQLITVLKSLKIGDRRSKKEMISLGEKYLAMNRDDRKEYISKFQKLVDSSKLTSDNEFGNSEEDSSVSVENNNSSSVTEPVIQSKNEKESLPTEDALICPRCGKPLALRTAKRGARTGKQFYGCSGFPSCRYIQNIDDE